MMRVRGTLAGPVSYSVLTFNFQHFLKCIHRDRIFQSDLLKVHVGVEWLGGELQEKPLFRNCGLLLAEGLFWQHLCVGRA